MYDLHTRFFAAMARSALEVLVLARAWRQIERTVETDRRRNRLVHQRIERRDADRAEHLVAIGGAHTDVTRGEEVLVKPGAT